MTLDGKQVLIVDDDAFNREGVRLYLESQGLHVSEASDEEAAGLMARATAFDAAVIDVSIPPDARTPSHPRHSFGVRLARQLKESFPSMGVVLFSAYEDRGGEVLEMVGQGVRGIAYKLKGGQPKALLGALQEVAAGRVVIDPEVHVNQRALADELRKRLSLEERRWVEAAVASFIELTPREREIAHRLAASHNTEGIAQALGVTGKTAENYIGRVYEKLGLNEMGHEAPHLRKVVVLAKACMIQELGTR